MAHTPSTTPQGDPIDNPAIVLTRPAGSLLETALACRSAGLFWPVLFSPVQRIDPVTPTDIPEGRLIFTSQHAVARACALGLCARVAIAVGPATARVARSAGFDCATGPGDAASLIPWLLENTSGPLVHLHGHHIAMDLSQALRDAGRSVESRTVYAQTAQSLSTAARMALTRSETILPIYSPRSARLVAADPGGESCSARIVAISPAAAEAWPFPAKIHIAADTSGPAMVAAMASLVAAGPER